MACVVKGYDEAVEKEQLARNAVYLDQPVIVCGEPLRNLTPHLLVIITVMRTPFYFGGAYNHASLAQFLWALHRDYSPRSWWKRRQLIKRASRLDLQKAADDIAEYFDLTFVDAPMDARKEKPIASDVAWLVYRFRNTPWNQSEQVTIHAPFRKLYQELRCWQKENGQDVNNRSDKLKSIWLEQVNDDLKNGRITQKQLDEWNEMGRKLRNGEISQKQFDEWNAVARGNN